MSKLGDQPAFPCPENTQQFQPQGITKREYFAGLALQGMLAACCGPQYNERGIGIARNATVWADALLDELEKEPK